jgi:hypothetical protein
LWNFDAWSQILTGKTRNHTTPLYENQTFAHRHQLPISFFSPCERVFFAEKRQKKKVIFDINSCLKPNLDRQNTRYYHTTKWKSNLGSQAWIGSIYVFDSPCARVFLVRKHRKNW